MGEHPFYRFFRHVSFELDHKIWQKMPRHPSFKHEYWNGKLHWTPRPNTCDVYLDLEQWRAPEPGKWSVAAQAEPITVRQLREEDWEKLPRAFCAASSQSPPLSQWHGAAALRAARCVIEWARCEKDGPLIAQVCFVAVAGDPVSEGGEELIAGGAIVTHVASERLRGAPRTVGEYLPHLDWIFVGWMHQRRGVATLLLDAVVRELRELGHCTLASTVLTGYAPAMLWHWRNGFRLPHGGR